METMLARSHYELDKLRNMFEFKVALHPRNEIEVGSECKIQVSILNNGFYEWKFKSISLFLGNICMELNDPNFHSNSPIESEAIGVKVKNLHCDTDELSIKPNETRIFTFLHRPAIPDCLAVNLVS